MAVAGKFNSAFSGDHLDSHLFDGAPDDGGGLVVKNLTRSAFLTTLRSSPDAALGLVKSSAREVQAQRSRIEILRLRRVSDRLDAWLDLYGEPAKREWVRVADGIGVSPSALYREIALRKANDPSQIRRP